MSVDYIDYEDIYDINDYEYPYNHIEFVDDYDDEVYLEYDKVVGIKISDI